MKQVYLLSLLLCITALSCSKTDEEPASTANFTITGVRNADLTTNASASDAYPISIVSSSGTAEKVTLTADGLPKGAYAEFRPSSGTTPFTAQVKFWYDYSGSGGNYPVSVVGYSPSGTRSYKMDLKLDPYRGWKFGDSIYHQTELLKDQGSSNRYPNIKVYGGGAGTLTISFGMGKSLPVANKVYKITTSAGTSDDIQITMFDDPVIYSATGVGNPTGTFRFDSLGKFKFICTGVEMSNGSKKRMLDVSINER
jgi:hypothetical protein